MKTLKYYRVEAGLSVKEVAAHISVSPRIVYDWEAGSRTIGTYYLVCLLDLYQVDLPISAIPSLIPETFSERTPAAVN